MTMVILLPDDTFQCLMMLDEFMFDDNLAHDPEKWSCLTLHLSIVQNRYDFPLNPGWLIRYPYNGLKKKNI